MDDREVFRLDPGLHTRYCDELVVLERDPGEVGLGCLAAHLPVIDSEDVFLSQGGDGGHHECTGDESGAARAL